jgi:Restriction endonuclease
MSPKKKFRRRKLPPASPAKRQRIRLHKAASDRVREALLRIADEHLRPEERSLDPRTRLELYHQRIDAALRRPGTTVAGDVPPPGPEREHLVEFDLGPEIFVVTEGVWRGLVRELASRPGSLKTIDRRTFEELVAFLFEGFGYEVELTKKTRDGGRDVVAVRRAEIHTKYLIECKRPDPGTPIGIRPVRELYGVKQDEGASKAILATTTYFGPDALLFMERHRWELEPRDYLGVLDWINRYVQTRADI